MSNILIVESKNDKYFSEAFIYHINTNSEIKAESIIIDEYTPLNGLDKNKLIIKFKELKNRIDKEIINKIGLLIDLDNDSIENRLKFVSNALNEVFPNSPVINKINTLYSIKTEDNDFLFACHFTNINENGNLETVLKEIKNNDSPHADCLYQWKKCLDTKNIDIKESDFNKLWISFYHRYDCCSKRDRKQAQRKCVDFEVALKKDIYNWEHEKINTLKEFLLLFS